MLAMTKPSNSEFIVFALYKNRCPDYLLCTSVENPHVIKKTTSLPTVHDHEVVIPDARVSPVPQQQWYSRLEQTDCHSNQSEEKGGALHLRD